MYLTDLNRSVSIEAIITYIQCYNKLNNETIDELVLTKTESIFSLGIEDLRSFQFLLIECIMEKILNNHQFRLSKKLFLMVKVFLKVR
jgi:hypothetical protein